MRDTSFIRSMSQDNFTPMTTYTSFRDLMIPADPGLPGSGDKDERTNRHVRPKTKAG
jgi:hypothetical protein